MATALRFRATDKDVQSLGQWAVHGGWTYTGLNGNGHHNFRWKDGSVCVIPSTPSDSRSLLNARAHMRRIMGWEPPVKKPRTVRQTASTKQSISSKAMAAQILSVLDEVVEDICSAAKLNGKPDAATHALLVQKMVHQRIH